MSAKPRQPAVFAAQGFPPLLESERWSAEFGAWGDALPRPTAILVVSAHWEARELLVGSTADPVPLYYDFTGFPQHFYEVTWPASPAVEVAARVTEVVEGWLEVGSAPTRGLDHGAFVPLKLMFPNHDVPIVQISQPSLAPAVLYELGSRLAVLRDEGVLIFTTGLLTHHAVGVGEFDPPLPAFVEFDQWVADALRRGDLPALLDYEQRAPHVDTVLPSREHFTPLFVALGAAETPRVTFPTTGFWYGNSMRSVELN